MNDYANIDVWIIRIKPGSKAAETINATLANAHKEIAASEDKAIRHVREHYGIELKPW